jgi:hypothetical protein
MSEQYKFIELVGADGENILINIDAIACVVDVSDGYRLITTSGREVLVAGPRQYTEIARVLKSLKR